jgi:hypothetical protein
LAAVKENVGNSAIYREKVPILPRQVRGGGGKAGR